MFPPNISIDGIFLLCNYLNGDITVLPTQHFFSSKNFIFECFKIFSSSYVASSLGRFFHCTKYSLIVLLLNLLSLVFKTFYKTSVRCNSSSKGGSVSEMTIYWPIDLFRQETWNTLWILLPSGSSNSYATSPIFRITL